MPSCLADLGAVELIDGYRSRQFSPAEALEAVGERIEEHEGWLHALASLRMDEARAEAQRATTRYARDSARDLEGVPFVVKDLICTADLPTRCGHPTFKAPRVDAAGVARLRAAGAILLGKTTTHQFGLGITTVPDHDESPTCNPWDPLVVAGGSSGGSAAAVAMSFAPLALGTDTAGSIRIPADFCGVVGLRPTPGTVPIDGVVPLAPSLDALGPMARSPREAGLALGVLANRPVNPVRKWSGPAGLRIGVTSDLEPECASQGRLRRLTEVAERLAQLEADIVTLRLPANAGAFETLATLVSWEALRTHEALALWPRHRESYDADVRLRLEGARRVTSADYAASERDRERLRAELTAAFDDVDVLLSLASAAGPCPVHPGGGGEDFRRLAMSCAAPQSLAGVPSCVIPAGFDEQRHPVGVQLTGPPGSDRWLLDLAQALLDAGLPS